MYWPELIWCEVEYDFDRYPGPYIRHWFIHYLWVKTIKQCNGASGIPHWTAKRYGMLHFSAN